MEIYSLDIDSERGRVLYGSGADMAELYDYANDLPICRVEDFDDSVLFVKFVQNNRLIIVSLTGRIELIEETTEVFALDINEEVTAAGFNENLVLGTSSGHVYLYDETLEHINTFGGHSSEITDVKCVGEYTYSMSRNRFIVHDRLARIVYRHSAPLFTVFCCIGQDVFALARDARLDIIKGSRKLAEIPAEGTVTALEMAGKTLVVGGAFEHIMLVDTVYRYSVFKLDVKMPVSAIRAASENIILFSSTSDMIGLVDIRNIDSLRLYEPGVGTIFDFAISGNDIAAGGENGLSVFTTEDARFPLDFVAAVEAVATEQLTPEDSQDAELTCSE